VVGDDHWLWNSRGGDLNAYRSVFLENLEKHTSSLEKGKAKKGVRGKGESTEVQAEEGSRIGDTP